MEVTQVEENVEEAQTTEPVVDETAQVEEVESWDSERALAKIKKANAEAKRLRERVKEAEAKADGVDAVRAELAETKKALAASEAAALRQKVAHTYGLDPVLAGRLRGDTEDALQQDAQALLEVIQAGQRPQQRRAPFVPMKDPSQVSDRDIRQMVANSF